MSLILSPGASPVPGYTLVRFLGEGGFGKVWEALAPGGIHIAMKFVRMDRQELISEERAIRTVSNIRHPHLLDIQFATRVEEYLVIAMPLCEKSLLNRLHECVSEGSAGLPFDELIEYMGEIARAVDYLNEPRHDMGDGRKVGVQHRDIKPHNIFLVGDSARLADFGLAKILEGRTAEHTGNMSVQYVAPEVFDGKMSQQTDQFSLAMTYYHLRTGRLPFQGDSIGKIIYARMNEDPDLSDLPEAEQAVLSRALARNASERWPNCRAFARALLAAVPPEHSELPPPPPSRQPVPSETHPASDLSYPQYAVTATQPVFQDPSFPHAGGGFEATPPHPISAGPNSQSPPPQPPPVLVTPPPVTPTRWPVRLLAGGGSALFVGCVLIALIPGLREKVLPLASSSGEQTAAQVDPSAAQRAAAVKAMQTSGALAQTPPVTKSTNPSTEQPEGGASEAASRVDQAAESASSTEPTPITKVAGRPGNESPPKSSLDQKRDAASTSTGEETASPLTLASNAKTREESGGSTREDSTEPSKPRPEEVLPIQEGDLATTAKGLLKKYCYRCHGVRFETPNLNVLDHDALVAKRGADELPFVSKGNPEESELWVRLGQEKDMPPSGAKPTDAERNLIRRWIEAGAEFPLDASNRPIKGEKEVLLAIRDHLRGMREADRGFQRYFTIHNLLNNKTFSNDDIRLARAATSKLINSLSWEPDLVVPKAIDREEAVFALDIRSVGWDEHDRWGEILTYYPYGLKHDQGQDQDLREVSREVYLLAKTNVPFIRADWFIAHASRPPLYHALVKIPEHANELEKTLRVDTVSDFMNGKLKRAGFATSGVSSQNRLVDRHSASYGAYWKSFDFKSNTGKGNLPRNPLGPVFHDNPYPRLAFEQAGGEIIFNLPNGLQGYMLVDDKDQRIDVGPIEVVGDSLKTAGTAAIVNGLSCMACHAQGILTFKDTVRQGAGVFDAAAEKVEQLYPEQAEMDKLIARDQKRFVDALEVVMGPFLQQGDDQDKPIRDFAEPVGLFARIYLKDLGPEEVAAELGLNDPKELATMFRANKTLRAIGLAPLLNGNPIKRTDWDSLDGKAMSTFQEAAQSLGLGTPVNSF